MIRDDEETMRGDDENNENEGNNEHNGKGEG